MMLKSLISVAVFDKLYLKYDDSEVYICLRSVVMFIYFLAFSYVSPVMPNALGFRFGKGRRVRKRRFVRFLWRRYRSLILTFSTCTGGGLCISWKWFEIYFICDRLKRILVFFYHCATGDRGCKWIVTQVFFFIILFETLLVYLNSSVITWTISACVCGSACF